MTLENALQWAKNNCTPEATSRLRSRDAVATLAAEVGKLRKLLERAECELNCGDEGDVFDRSHRCGKCDENIDRNGALRTDIAAALK